jgi:hypothetical protein
MVEAGEVGGDRSDGMDTVTVAGATMLSGSAVATVNGFVEMGLEASTGITASNSFMDLTNIADEKTFLNLFHMRVKRRPGVAGAGSGLKGGRCVGAGKKVSAATIQKR